MSDTSWTIHTADYGELTISGAIGDTLPTMGVGREVELTLRFDGADDEAFEPLYEYAQYSNESSLDVGSDIRGKPWYREKLHPASDYSSTLVLIEPGADVGPISDWWAVITDAELITTAVGTNPRLTVTLFVLAEGREYNARRFAEDEFKSEL